MCTMLFVIGKNSLLGVNNFVGNFLNLLSLEVEINIENKTLAYYREFTVFYLSFFDACFYSFVRFSQYFIFIPSE